ncbi:hypothetical protein WJ63_29940 [Burkholderia pyrrocinia]|nr:hypothetical protein WJ63_29940 [Burkholderia pyrrocinia]
MTREPEALVGVAEGAEESGFLRLSTAEIRQAFQYFDDTGTACAGTTAERDRFAPVQFEVELRQGSVIREQHFDTLR